MEQIRPGEPHDQAEPDRPGIHLHLPLRRLLDSQQARKLRLRGGKPLWLELLQAG